MAEPPTIPSESAPAKPAVKLAYGVGALSEVMLVNTVKQLANPVMTITLGVSPGLVGIILAIPRLWDAFIDPVVGSISDRTQTRWGRRRPFIAVGGVLAAIALFCVWLAPFGWTERGYFWYFLLGSIVFYSAYAIFAIPWTALGYELSGDYHDRTRLMSVRTFFTNLGGFLPPWILALTQLKVFRDTLEGARYVSLGIGVVAILCCFVAAAFAKENPHKRRAAKAESLPFFKSVGSCLKTRPFLMLCGIVLLMLFSIYIADSLGLYINIYYVCGGDMGLASKYQGLGGTIYNAISIGTVFVIPAISARIGKKRSLVIFFSVALVASIMRWFCYVPGLPWLILIPNFLIAPAFCAMWILINSMISDLCDLDEVRSGCRREGMFGAVYAWLFKTGLSIAYIFGGYILVFAGFNVSHGAAQPPGTFMWMRLVFVIMPTIAVLGAIILAWRYPVSEKDVRDARTLLNQR